MSGFFVCFERMKNGRLRRAARQIKYQISDRLWATCAECCEEVGDIEEVEVAVAGEVG
jgi:hypothetical protein